jgi:hypothetical protein
MGCTNGTEGSLESDIDSRSPRELLETVRARIEGESVISPWSTVDTRIGNLTVHLSERCFETEIYADEAGYGSERYYDVEQRRESIPDDLVKLSDLSEQSMSGNGFLAICSTISCESS